MNATQLINMAVRIVMRKFLNKGIDAGIDMATRRRQDTDPADRRDAHAQAQDTKKRVKQSMRIARRIGRF
ncbi:hypothetical protein EV663_103174 [Rhodovulum bhavnagarense]|uniref:Uncharacterized protein n=1 Tax=Rhodovulum bhavnagarense TaxID=992286 RepID=A0A4R2RIL5_9RHOB|nr:hypothetical protein [Rhodovulum bhavnagarense]TCP61987.1 hypothetical protein EV663_103174 [Rhodovulum bhavnagarense]